MPKLLIGVTPQLNRALREACKHDAIANGRDKPTPIGSFVETILARSAVIKRAAKSIGVVIPKRPTDGRGKYPRA